MKSKNLGHYCDVHPWDSKQCQVIFIGHVTLKVSQPLLATVGFKTDLLLFLAEVPRIFFHNQLALTQFGDGYDIR